MRLLQEYDVPLEGARAVVVGRSDIVGKPAALLLLHANATVTICHSRTMDLGAVTREADVLVVAVGQANVVGPDDVKEGAAVIDVLPVDLEHAETFLLAEQLKPNGGPGST
jgi:methylenetetrahydrofolate dehydrogenase (NADP+)/methenyltetrahydrofolate cyclohydrolase